SPPSPPRSAPSYLQRGQPSESRWGSVFTKRRQRHYGRRYEPEGKISSLAYVVRDLGRSHWGLYYTLPKHLVAVHWAVFSMPAQLIEYVLTHEMAHATGPAGRSHGHAWQRQMNQWMPDWRQRQAELIELGRHAWIGDWNREK
ncbi:YgjP-like metallopeptidase domain-containing protein, partial [Lentzea sp. NPDC051838]|uniref:YgjP-like metallopeptidase domain-containing protein n=1 Tax=Lentzea sp. NPDC051838 TaxID=3154849 RepID=UPI0034391AF0